MSRFVWGSLITLALGVSSASAQLGVYQRPYQPRPPISPYLNLNRGGNAAINYYGLVRPQIETTRSLQNVEYQLQNTAAAAAALPTTTDPTVVAATTGHPVMFLNSSHYFPTSTGRVGAGGGSIGSLGGGFGSGGLNPFFPVSTTGVVRR